MTADRALVEAVRTSLRAAADPVRAPQMQRYMKSSMPYLGVPSPALRSALRQAFVAHPLASAQDWRDTVEALWRGAAHREERYAAIELAKLPRYRKFRDRATLPLYEAMIVEGAWWDYVDTIASHLLGELLDNDTGWATTRMRRWARDEHLWKRRASIICQLNRRDRLDVDLLSYCIEANLGDRDFFIRKAIGWALRQHARHDPDWVRAFVETHEGLSPLSRREAMKHLG